MIAWLLDVSALVHFDPLAKCAGEIREAGQAHAAAISSSRSTTGSVVLPLQNNAAARHESV
jgi:hypothetical protein